MKPIVPERSDTNEYAEPFHRYNLEFSASVKEPFSMIANSPVLMPDGLVSAVKLATLVYVFAMLKPKPVSPLEPVYPISPLEPV